MECRRAVRLRNLVGEEEPGKVPGKFLLVDWRRMVCVKWTDKLCNWKKNDMLWKRSGQERSDS